MDFDLDADERALQQGVRELVTGRATSERIRAAADTGGVDRDLWRELADTGVFALALPEDEGGLDLGATHATVVFEELGRGLVPGPLVASHLAAELVDGAADGSVVVTDVDRGARVLHDLDGSDVVVVVDDDGLWRVAAGDVDARAAARPLDPLTPVSAVDGLPTGDRIGDAVAAADWRRRRTLLTCALLLGTAVGSLELMVAYAGQREQFGRVIGSFQAVKHLCSDALTRSEVARAAVYAAACHMAGVADGGDVDEALATAALLTSRAAVENGATGIQVHGGMGFTWEVDAHLHHKRAHTWAARVGGVHTNAERVAAAM